MLKRDSGDTIIIQWKSYQQINSYLYNAGNKLEPRVPERIVSIGKLIEQWAWLNWLVRNEVHAQAIVGLARNLLIQNTRNKEMNTGIPSVVIEDDLVVITFAAKRRECKVQFTCKLITRMKGAFIPAADCTQQLGCKEMWSIFWSDFSQSTARSFNSGSPPDVW